MGLWVFLFLLRCQTPMRIIQSVVHSGNKGPVLLHLWAAGVGTKEMLAPCAK